MQTLQGRNTQCNKAGVQRDRGSTRCGGAVGPHRVEKRSCGGGVCGVESAHLAEKTVSLIDRLTKTSTNLM